MYRSKEYVLDSKYKVKRIRQAEKGDSSEPIVFFLRINGCFRGRSEVCDF